MNDLKACAVINGADAQGRDNDDAIAALGTIDGVDTLSAVCAQEGLPQRLYGWPVGYRQHPRTRARTSPATASWRFFGAPVAYEAVRIHSGRANTRKVLSVFIMWEEIQWCFRANPR